MSSFALDPAKSNRSVKTTVGKFDRLLNMFPASADFNGNKNRKLPVNAKPEERLVCAVNEFNITSAAEREKRLGKKNKKLFNGL